MSICNLIPVGVTDNSVLGTSFLCPLPQLTITPCTEYAGVHSFRSFGPVFSLVPCTSFPYLLPKFLVYVDLGLLSISLYTEYLGMHSPPIAYKEATYA